MTSRFSCLLLLGCLVAASPVQEHVLITVELGRGDFSVGRPPEWRPGILEGPATLVHFIGSPDGFPHFTAMSDAESALPEDTSDERIREAVEEMFATVSAGDDIHEAGWTEIDGLEVHSSLATRNSVAGSITRRRLLFAHEGVPYVLVWADYARRYESIAELIEACVQSLARGRGGRVAALAPVDVVTDAR